MFIFKSIYTLFITSLLESYNISSFPFLTTPDTSMQKQQQQILNTGWFKNRHMLLIFYPTQSGNDAKI